MDLDAALNLVAVQGAALRESFCLPWSEQVQQAVCALRFRRQADEAGRPVQLAAVVGGASSGKSTVFNNLLGGHRVSMVTMRSHATRGLIVAAHERQAERLDRWLDHHRTLLPTLGRRAGQRDVDLQGEPETATVVQHDRAGLEDTLLIDTPDFTSNTAEREGDVTLSLLPWFDRLVVIVDHERWFDRQVVDQLAVLAERFAQARMVVFNRTAEHPLADADRERLEEQARHLGARPVCILEYQRGRGFRRLEPRALQEVLAFLGEPAPPRDAALRAEIKTQATGVLSANRVREEGLGKLEGVLASAAKRCVPTSRWDCVTALMTPEEREHLGLVSRVLGVIQMREWLGRQRRWIEQAMPRWPWSGKREIAVPPASPSKDHPEATREQRGRDWLTAQCERQIQTLKAEVAASDFWEELRLSGCAGNAFGAATARERSVGAEKNRSLTVAALKDAALKDAALNGADLDGGVLEPVRARADEAVTRLANALDAWDAKVRDECTGVSPRLAATLGMTILAGAAILVAVPGPVAALTPVIAAGALKAGLAKLAAAGVFGAVSGRPMARLAEIIREKLLASPEFNTVRDAAEDMRLLIVEHARLVADRLGQEARGYTLTADHPLRQALEVLCRREGRSA